ncbi:MAG: 5-(carboxyamino)imidazole ribonucleotide mutase [Syntrophobacterales bacterium]|nr:5-(carboxyamino)imidazole ribonucleotide mutase [Syntrophobacterales bacterium]
MTNPVVAVLMGSDSDMKVMEGALEVLKSFGVPYEVKILSAHRVPDEVASFARGAEARGIKVIIAGAGWAAHLAGAIAANTILPVIGVPIDSSPLQGWDALLSTVQMPPGIPVATVSVGKGGAKNAAFLAIEILGLENKSLREKLISYRTSMKEEIMKKNEELSNKLE